jgi:hypothetical protein
MGIKLKFASVAHPKKNGQVKKANGLICNGIKKRLLAPLKKAKHAWVDKLPSVLWSLRTTPNAATQETPFFLVHGAEAVLPIEITHEAPRIVAYDETTSTEALQDDVNALDEARDVALARATQYQQNLRNYHSSRVHPRSFVVGDLVLRLKQDRHGKLESPWVGPYIMTEVIPGGAYRLQDKKTEKDESNPWNAEQLRWFYVYENYGDKKLSRYNPLNREHEATGRVPWANSTICMHIFSFHSGAQTLESYEI